MANEVVTGNLTNGELPWNLFRDQMRAAECKIGDTLDITVDEKAGTCRVEVIRAEVQP